jgi:hypothetical protein
MSVSLRRRPVVIVLALAAAVAVAAAALITSCSRTRPQARADIGAGIATKPAAARATIVTVDGAPTGRAIARGFLGVSLEFPAIMRYAGSDPSAINPVLVQLLRNLAPGQEPVLRIGGDSTDLTWWRVPDLARPVGVKYTLTPRAIAVMKALVTALGARVILGIDLEANNTRVAAAETRALIGGLGRGRIGFLEFGNEPELYGSFTWDGSGITGRPRGYDFAGYRRDLARMVRALPKVPVAAPATGSVRWFPDVGELLATQRHIAMVTLHRYPLKLCFTPPSEPTYPTIANLLAPAASRGLADSVAADVRISHRRRVPLRIDEMNTISCGSAQAVSKRFASALWVLDALFQMARVGVDGVNIHTYPRATYALFTFEQAHGRWRAFVEPEYYGMLMFAQAAPPGSRFLRLSWRAPGGDSLKAWVTRASDGRLHVVLINDGAHAQNVTIRDPGSTSASTLERLSAPSLGADHHVTLGGQSFGSETETGLLAGRPATTLVRPEAGQYSFRLAGVSAALLTIAKS